MATSFAAWRHLAQLRSAALSLTKRAVARGAARALAAWSAEATAQRVHRALLRRHGARRDALLLVAALAGWQLCAQAAVARRARAARLVTAKVSCAFFARPPPWWLPPSLTPHALLIPPGEGAMR